MSCDEMKLKLAVMTAKKRIRELWYQTGGACYLAFSGGKDSTVVLALIKQLMDEGTIPEGAIPAVYCDTRLEYDVILRFVEWVKDNWYSNVEIIKPEKTFAEIIREYGKPAVSKTKSEHLSRMQRNRENGFPDGRIKSFGYLVGVPKDFRGCTLGDKHIHMISTDFDIRISNKCCDFLKKKPNAVYRKQHNIEGYFTGERMAEGSAREKNFVKKLASGQNICTAYQDNVTKKMPIVDWDDETLEAFIEQYNVPLSQAYTIYGLKRTGCYLCPFSPRIQHDLEVTCQYEPKKYRAALGFLKDVYIAQGVELPFDEEYMAEFRKTFPKYEAMRAEMLRKYRPNSRLLKKYDAAHEQISFEDY